MRRNRLLPLGTTLLAVLVLATAAPVLESTAISAPYDVSADADAGADGLSLMGVLFLFVSAFVELVFGVELDQIGLSGASGASGGLVLVIVPLLTVGLVVGAFYLAARRFSVSSTDVLTSRLLGQSRSEQSLTRSSTDENWPPIDPESDVDKAWAKMTTAIDVDRPTARTPAEWGDAAIDAGLDADAVNELTRTFRDRQYGEIDETAEHRRRARRALHQLEDDIE
ncbi:DUF4129 domain-containing protein [Halostagnicola sp. A-GB9-2]|uniref:DUF4129 domain-containing protein n=1 Tax=Halostagnicola sp. A-GB9-2 TaxID=3048066 RepID=UPI0024BFCF85|nr:DUF4129 domain-containing protein [Halostagnicola sp. A-GB9-2]MDJ1434143.1 DUF4129 domain-containing protein [Halostagnicola sp. A-GB9-2]